MMAQSGACNGLHPTEQRLARWLLTLRDRVGRDFFQITQDFLAQMPGAQRPTLTIAARNLQQAGLITYHYGHVQILDSARLEEDACECYATIRDLYALTFKAERQGQ
jgi:CRP-like cAMP-binding protein